MKVDNKLQIRVTNKIIRKAIDFNYKHTTIMAIIPLIMFKNKQSELIAVSESINRVSSDITLISSPGSLVF